MAENNRRFIRGQESQAKGADIMASWYCDKVGYVYCMAVSRIFS